MAVSETREILIKGANGGSAEGTLHIRKYSRRDRVMRGLRMLGVLWLLAVLAILIPLAHFILVPALLLAGPIVGFRRYRDTEHNEQVTGDCPVCGKPMNIELDSSDRLPLWTYCPPSGDPIRVVEEAGGSSA
jgi:hypothetical protein